MPISKGNIVKYHTQLQVKNLNKPYIVVETIANDQRSRAEIQAVNTGFSFSLINKV